MAGTSTLIENTFSSLPAWLTNISTSTGTATTSGGEMILTSGGSTGQDGYVISSTTYDLDSYYCRMYPVPAEPLAVAFNWFSNTGTLNGYGIGVGTSSSVPGDAEFRVNKLVASVSLTHPTSAPYDSTNMRWFKMERSGTIITFYTAPDGAGNGPGSWTLRDTRDYSTDLAAYSPTAVTLHNYSAYVASHTGGIARIDGINTVTSAAAGNAVAKMIALNGG